MPDEISRVQRLGKLWYLNPEQDLLWEELPAIAAVLEACSDEVPIESKEALETTRKADRVGLTVEAYLKAQRLARIRSMNTYKLKRKRFTAREIAAQTEANRRRDVRSGKYAPRMEG
jgi:hypothetical protein